MRTLLVSLALTLIALPAIAADKPVQPRTLTVAVGQTIRMQMSTRRPIKTVFNDNDSVVRVRSLANDPTTVLVTGLTPGVARITLIDADGNKESRDWGKPSGK